MSHQCTLCLCHKGGENGEKAGPRDDRGREPSQRSVWAAAWTGAKGTGRLRTHLALMTLDTRAVAGVQEERRTGVNIQEGRIGKMSKVS